MADSYASDFTEIPATLAVNAELRSSVERLVKQEPIPGKVLEGGNRLDAFRSILLDLIVGRVDLHEAYRRTGRDLPRTSSPYSRSNLVFAEGWEERLVRTQLSRFYNQAVMEKLRAAGHDKCFVAHSTDEDVNSRCSRELAGGTHDLSVLYDRLVASYRDGNWNKKLAMIPDHPHCTHTVKAPHQGS